MMVVNLNRIAVTKMLLLLMMMQKCKKRIAWLVCRCF